MNINAYAGVLIFCIFSTTTKGQFRLPRIDASLKTGFANYNLESGPTGYTYTYDGGFNVVEGNVHFLLTRNLSAGFYYEDSFNAIMKNKGAFDQKGTSTAAHQALGLSFRCSSGLRPVLRPYVQLTYSLLHMQFDAGNIKASNRSWAPGLGFGLLIRLKRDMYLNLFDVSVKKWQRGFFFIEGNPGYMTELKTGILMNFSRQK